jgi:DNA-binding response OmpR family regulator
VRILFVDNHPEFTASVVGLFLATHDVVVVPTIAGAKHKIESETFDVVLVDYDLDDGKGDELIRWLRAAGASAKLVAVSARDTGNDALVAAGADAVCGKLNFAKIAAVLHQVHSSPRAT